jgi:hypothetical protein
MPHAMQIRHTGISPASVDDVTQNPAPTALFGARCRFKRLRAAATPRVQVQNATHLYFWNMGYSPGLFSNPAACLLCLSGGGF